MIQQLESFGERAVENPADVSLLISYCSENLIPHADAEEKVLYAEVDDEELVSDMTSEHKEIKSKLADIGNALSAMDGEVIAKECRGFLDLLKEHFEKEENILIPKLKLKLTAEDFLKLIEKVHDMESSIRKSDLGELYEIDHRRIDFNIVLFKNSIDSKENSHIHYKRFRDQILRHTELEEKLLFPAFSEYGDNNKLESLGSFLKGHRRLLSILSTLEESPDKIQELINFLANHSKAEEEVYPEINRLLPPQLRQQIFIESFAGFSEV